MSETAPEQGQPGVGATAPPAEENVLPAPQTVDEKLDALLTINQWMAKNLEELFKFISVMGQSGGGLRGLMSVLKNGQPQMQPEQSPEEVSSHG